jgi:glycerate kinase
MRVLLCPDKFRGTATAAQVASAIATGWRRVRPGDDIRILTMADGGEGTLEALTDPDERRIARVTGPMGDPVPAAWGLRAEGTAIIEMATAAGLALLAPERRDPRRATTAGVGELLIAAVDAGASRALVSVGGSATNDGGAGMARALGVRFLDDRGGELPDGAAALARLARVDLDGLHPRVRALEVTALVDVDNPLCGPRGASATYGPQKGADADTVWELDRALERLAAVVARDLGVDRSREAGAGAAGGLGFGLMAFLGARLRPGVEAVSDAVGLVPAIERADLVVTGEGALDATSLRGKVVGGVLSTAALAGRRAAVVCGRADVAVAGAEVVALVDLVGADAAMHDTRIALERAGQTLAETQP